MFSVVRSSCRLGSSSARRAGSLSVISTSPFCLCLSGFNIYIKRAKIYVVSAHIKVIQWHLLGAKLGVDIGVWLRLADLLWVEE